MDARRASMRSVQTLQTLPVLHEDANKMPTLPLPVAGGTSFDNGSRSSLSRPSTARLSVRQSFPRNSGAFDLATPEFSDEAAHKKWLEQQNALHRQRPTTVYSYPLLVAQSPAGSKSKLWMSDNSSADDSIMSVGTLAEPAQKKVGGSPLALELGEEPVEPKTRHCFLFRFSWWRAFMMLLLLVAIGVGLGLGLKFGLQREI